MKVRRVNSIVRSSVIIFFISFLYGCEDETISPRPFGYFRIDLPEAKYVESEFGCPYGFEHSDQAQIVIKDRDRCWVNIYYPKYKATIYLTYIGLNDDLKTQLDQTQQLTYEHQIKATRIDRMPLANDSSHTYGLKYRLEGDVASYVQFYLTDSTDHFVRGALYFESYVNADSLRPVVKYMDNDIQHLISSFHWN